MQKVTRDYAVSDNINNLEFIWWNENARTIADVWEMHSDISWRARKRYLLKAKSFFQKKNSPVTVLELGCGSGWVGQSIAGPDLRIIGTDFSESQIGLARENAERKHLNEFCQYFVSNTDNLKGIIKNVDGVLFHSFLHHLDGQEIERLFSDLTKQLNPGTKMWLYEPAFYVNPSTEIYNISYITGCLVRMSNFFVSSFHKLCNKYKLINENTSETFLNLMEQAANKDWYLSPKEIPFDVEDFSDQLKKYMHLGDSYWATIYLIGWIFEINLVKNNILRKILSLTLLPFLAFADRRFSYEEDHIKSILAPPAYAFYVWQGYLKNE